MKIRLSELRKFIREAVIPDDDDEIDLGDPITIGSNKYDMDDQETSTQVANRRIKFDPDCADEIEAMEKLAPALRYLALGESLAEIAPSGWEKAIKKMKKDKNKKGSVNNPWALAYWMKDKGYKPK